MAAKAPDYESLEQFEHIMERLELIVRQLEGGQTKLADSLRWYLEAAELSQQAEQLLRYAESIIRDEAVAEETPEPHP